MWSANGSDTPLATTFVNSTQLTALIPTGSPQRTRHDPDVSVYWGSDGQHPVPDVQPRVFRSHGPTAAAGNRHDNRVRSDQHTLPTLPAPWLFRGYRDVSLDGSPWQTLSEGGSVTYSPVTPGTHRLLLSNPCTATHEPSAEDVSAAADEFVTVEVYIPPDCE